MSMVENLKRYRLTKYLYNKKSKNNIYTDSKKRKLNLPKSNSFSIKTEANKNNNKLIPVLSFKTPGEVSKKEIEEKLKKNYTQLQLNLSKFKQDLILAKSAEHKKMFELKKKRKIIK